MANPIISVCIPTYRSPVSLRKALQSVLMQRFQDYEIIITDDSPDDNVKAVVDEYLPNSRIRYQRNPVRLGSPGNWNAALTLARGEYIKILHHDDWLTSEDSLKHFLDIFESKPDTVLGFSATTVCDAVGGVVRIHRPTDKQLCLLKNDTSCLFPSNFIGGPSATMFRRKETALFDENLKWVVDLEFYARILHGTNAFSYCDYPLVATTNGSPNQVTHECLGNRRVQLFEWTYWYQSIFQNKVPTWSQLRFMWQLYRNNLTTSAADLLQIGVKAPIPFRLSVVLASCRVYQPLYRLLKVLHRRIFFFYR